MQPEARLRARCRLYLDAALPAPGWYSAVEHGRQHKGTEEERAREWARLKAQGVKNGFGDMLVLYMGIVAMVELKAGKNTTSDAQDAVAASVQANAGHYQVIRSVVQLHDWLVSLGVPILPAQRVWALDHDAKLAVPEKPKAKRKTQAVRPSPARLRKVHAMRSRVMF